ncbi:alcohol dehydrogenase iron-type [Trichococcus palustris]|jgi:glycerol dehydrogenase|uniref:Glycerol dehydrogenase n=1 Tax=Trichococcus palustris TaxID=140314 RepID=A0A143YV43_9LACT|nr:glycerol dehydrogenase [Trichococcus palustris]CZQ98152.1 alcohol dehydrogenase iron-type [Trichococcus palustris]SFK95419.1 glycerol 2-dehydrogenase (NAD+) [Trichococcus palustris]
MVRYAFRSPSLYIQGAGVIEALGKEASVYGKKGFLISDDVVWGLIHEKVENSLGGFPYYYEAFNGEASREEMVRLGEVVSKEAAEVIIGLGGGKIIDTAKGVAADCGLPVVIVPTSVSTDAPTSALSVIYSEDGSFEAYRYYDRNPDLVLVDTAIVIQAPIRFFASGMADAMATCVEAAATKKSGGTTIAGGHPTIAGIAIARACEETLFRDGISALRAVEKRVVTPAVEAIVEANTLLSGLGFENGGLAGAHAIHNGFTALTGEIHRLTHGEKVAYGVLVQLVLENRPYGEIKKYIDFFQAIGMPTTLEEMHLTTTTRAELIEVGRLAIAESNTMDNLSKHITAEAVAEAIIAVDALVKN